MIPPRTYTNLPRSLRLAYFPFLACISSQLKTESSTTCGKLPSPPRVGLVLPLHRPPSQQRSPERASERNTGGWQKRAWKRSIGREKEHRLIAIVLDSGIFGYINYLVEKDRKFILDTLVNGQCSCSPPNIQRFPSSPSKSCNLLIPLSLHGLPRSTQALPWWFCGT